MRLCGLHIPFAFGGVQLNYIRIIPTPIVPSSIMVFSAFWLQRQPVKRQANTALASPCLLNRHCRTVLAYCGLLEESLVILWFQNTMCLTGQWTNVLFPHGRRFATCKRITRTKKPRQTISSPWEWWYREGCPLTGTFLSGQKAAVLARIWILTTAICCIPVISSALEKVKNSWIDWCQF